MGLFPDANIKLLFAIHTCCAECMVQMEDKTKGPVALFNATHHAHSTRSLNPTINFLLIIFIIHW
jgi:hypothetical protein